MLLSLGLIISRLVGSRSLRDGKVVNNASAGLAVTIFGYLLFAAVHNQTAYYLSALIIGLGSGHMYPAFQTMFINLAPHTQRGTANSTLLISWDTGLGIGILVGGVLAEGFGYYTAFYAAVIGYLLGIAGFFGYVRGHYLRNRLR